MQKSSLMTLLTNTNLLILKICMYLTKRLQYETFRCSLNGPVVAQLSLFSNVPSSNLDEDDPF